MAERAPTEPKLTPEERALLEAGQAHFNRGEFFLCHDALEDLWTGLRGEGRDFVQGLIQIAVAFHHLGNGNSRGGQSLFERAEARLARYPDAYMGFDLAAWRGELHRRRVWLDEGDLAHAAEAPPAWRFERAASDVTEAP